MSSRYEKQQTLASDSTSIHDIRFVFLLEIYDQNKRYVTWHLEIINIQSFDNLSSSVPVNVSGLLIKTRKPVFGIKSVSPNTLDYFYTISMLFPYFELYILCHDNDVLLAISGYCTTTEKYLEVCFQIKLE